VTKVVLYTTPTCSQCAKARAWFKERGIPYTEYNIIEDPEALKRMVELSGSRNVPVVQIGERVIVGFDPPEMEACLAGK
jgi:glutaredoxin-like YruB-family protein